MPSPPNSAAVPIASSDTQITARPTKSTPVVANIRFSYARSSMLLTDVACHWPPRAVATPRAFSAAAISLSVFAPAFCASRMMGSTLAANLSAPAVTASTALLRAIWSLGLPRATPRAFTAARACRVRLEMRASKPWRRTGAARKDQRDQERHKVCAMRPVTKWARVPPPPDT
jgi:hypothetical protein